MSIKTPFYLICALCLWVLSTAVSAGSADYALPVIAPASDGQILTSSNTPKTLFEIMDSKIVLLSFIYTTCNDVNGCPLATQTLHKIARQLAKQPDLAKQVRLITLSFNPEDTPDKMRAYSANFVEQGLDWQFLSARDEASLQPILAAYPQNIQKVYDQQGQFTGTFNHLLRVYLIDAQKNVRNIYSADLLQVEHLLDDMQILLKPATPTSMSAPPDQRFQAGDNKQQYQTADYQTQSIALHHRQGKPVHLIEFAQKPPLGLPTLNTPKDNPLSTAKIALGRKLFYDRRLSLNNTFSCAMCHIPEQGFGSNEMATAVGVEGRSVRRNSPTLYNVGYAQLLFHDGRETSLEQQAWGPLLAHNEMANPSIGFVIDKLKSLADYRGLFEQAFRQPVNMLNVGQALASYQRTLNSADSAFDRWYFGKQSSALSIEAQRGFALFTDKAGCSQCHTIGNQTALFTDHQRHNTGIGYQASMQTSSNRQKIQVAPGMVLDVDKAQLASVQQAPDNDLGYYEISQNPQDRWTYKTPSLRNVALTAPYMHDGSLASLAEVIAFYNRGGIANENRSPRLKALDLSDSEQADLIAFLQSLTGSNVEQLVGDGFAATQAPLQQHSGGK